MTIRFFMPGPPATKGSFRAVRNPRTGGTRLINDNRRTKGWSASVALLARHKLHGKLIQGPCHVDLIFYIKGDPEGKPDVDKVLRAALDALTGSAYPDDCHVVSAQVTKRQVSDPKSEGCWISVSDDGGDR